MSKTPKDQDQDRQKPDLPDSTLRIMERMVKTPPGPQKATKRPSSKTGRRNASKKTD